MATIVPLAERKDRLKNKLWEALIQQDRGVYLARTGSLLRGRDLRGHVNRKVFQKILEAFPLSDGEVARYWTKKLMRDSIDALVTDFKLVLPQLPGFNYSDWLKEQTKLFHELSKKARRNFNRSSSGSMDSLQTLAYNPEDWN